MFNPYEQSVSRLAFVFAHCGSNRDSRSRVYAVSAAVICSDGSRENFSSLVRYEGLGARDRYHSNISRDMLLHAPTPDEVSGRLRDFLKDAEFIFVLDGFGHVDPIARFCGGLRIVDLGFAVQFFLPHLKSFSFKSLWENFHHRTREKISFSADEIVDLSIRLVRHVCGTCLNDSLNAQAAAIRYYLKKSHTLFGSVFYHVTRHYRSYFGGLFDACKAVDTDNWRRYLETVELRKSIPVDEAPYTPVSPEHLEGLFRSMADSGKGYGYRPQQVRYAGHVARALNDSAVLTIEAGTGTGKTRGYLIPVLEFLYRNKGARVVISTYTKSLQEQLYQRELAAACDTFRHYSDIPVSLLKGKSSYICTVKLDDLYEETLSGPALLAWLYFVILALDFRRSDIDSIGPKIVEYLSRRVNFYHMLQEVSAKSHCHSGHPQCPARIVTAEAAAARLIVTNHHKLALLDHDSHLTGLFRNYIIDEANHFEQAVRNAYGEEIRSIDILATVDYMKTTAARTLKRAAGSSGAFTRNGLDRIRVLKDDVRTLHGALARIAATSGNGDVQPLPWSHPAFEDGHIKFHLRKLTDSLKAIGSCFDWCKDPDTCRMLKLRHRSVRRLRTALSQVEEYIESLKLIDTSASGPDHVGAFQCFQKHWTLTAQAVEVDELIRRQIFQKKEAVVFTAATLTYKGRFDCFREIVGMDVEDSGPDANAVPREFRYEKIPSPFSKDALEIIIPKEAVNARFSNKRLWMQSVIELLPSMIRDNRGRTLVLFSSYADLVEVTQQIETSVSEAMCPVLIQQKGSPTVNLCDEFRAVKESVLFGVDTFWYGVDFKGDTLTQVIISRIPYPSPFDPIQTARKKTLPPNAYWKRYHYETGIKLKQGIGRLIRCDTDRGRVVILDSRFKPSMIADGRV